MQDRAAAIDHLVEDGLLEMPSIEILSEFNNLPFFATDEEIDKQLASLRSQIVLANQQPLNGT